MADLEKIKQTILKGDIPGTKAGVKAALEAGSTAQDILDNGLIAGMLIVGEKFRCNEIFIPEVLISARAMQAGVAILEPLLTAAGSQPKGKVIIGTVRGDLHDIGKNLVGMMLKGTGFEIVDLGIDVPVEKFIAAVRQTSAGIIAMSSLLTTSMPVMAEVIKALKQEKLSAKTMVGGAPVTREFAAQIGADGYARDAATAVDVASKLLNI